MSWKEAQRVRLWQRHVMQGRVWWVWKGLNPRRGPHCSNVFAHLLETLRSMILVAQSEGGSTRRLPGLSADIVRSFRAS